MTAASAFPDAWEYDDWAEAVAPSGSWRRWRASFAGIDCTVDEEESIGGDQGWFSFLARPEHGSGQRDGSHIRSLDAAYTAAFAAAWELYKNR